MALLDLVQGVCDEVGLPRPTAVSASTEQLSRQMLSLANAELKELSKRYEWPVLQRTYAFNTVNATETYALPADFRALIAHTLYDSTQYYQMRGSISPYEWERVKSLNLGTLSRARVRIYGSPSMLHILPTPVSVEAVVYEYLTKNFAASSVGVEKIKFTDDTDVSLIDEDLVKLGLKWRIKHAKGLEFSADLAEYEAVTAREYARALAAPAITVGGGRLREDWPVTEGYVPERGFGT